MTNVGAVPLDLAAWPLPRITLCAYCGHVLGTETTLEHVIPKALGGATVDERSSLLKIPVHRRCNNMVANDADVRTALGWMAMMERHRIESATMDVGQAVTMAPISPRCLELADGRVVDCWCATTGWYWYHIHDPWPMRSRNAGTFARPPSGASRPHGMAFLAATVKDDRTALTHPDGAARAIRSGRAQFKGDDLYWLNILGSDQVEGFSPISPHLAPIRDEILRLARDREHNGHLPAVDMEGHRSFVAKVALGLGAALFGDNFVASRAAVLLREVLSAPSFDHIDQLPIEMAGFGAATNLVGVVLSNRDRHQVVLLPHGEGMVFLISLWGNPWFTAMCRTDYPGFENASAAFQDGAVYIVDLMRHAPVGPLPWVQYIAWAIGHADPFLDAAGLARPELEATGGDA